VLLRFPCARFSICGRPRAAALPLLGTASGMRPALAVDVPIYSSQLVHVHDMVLHHFSPCTFFAPWRNGHRASQW